MFGPFHCPPAKPPSSLCCSVARLPTASPALLQSILHRALQQMYKMKIKSLSLPHSKSITVFLSCPFLPARLL